MIVAISERTDATERIDGERRFAERSWLGDAAFIFINLTPFITGLFGVPESPEREKKEAIGC